MIHDVDDLILLFNQCFFKEYNTQLVRGSDEPLYLPATEGQPHNLLFFAHGFFASALHECAHWLIAGAARRQLIDFGYWYVPDGRSPLEQKLFQSVEVKPQAMEWILSQAAGSSFNISIDNLEGSEADVIEFKKAIYAQVSSYCQKGLNPRAERLRQALCAFYHTEPHLKISDFSLEALGLF